MALNNPMDSTVQEKVVNIIKEKFESEILSVETPYDFLTLNLKKEKIIEIIQYLYDHPEARFQYLTTLCGIHFPDVKQIAVMYQLHSLTNNWRIRLKIYLPG
jgi:NADH-quinone oxidoreductase subunit C